MTIEYDSSRAKLAADLKMLVMDAEILLKEAADCSAEEFVKLRARFEKNLHEAKTRLARTQAAMDEKARRVTVATQSYVKENPWQIAGIVAAAGVICGMLLGRRGAAAKGQSNDEIGP